MTSPYRHVQVQQNPYALVPEALGYDTRVTDLMFRVYFCLLRHGTHPGNCYPSHERIAECIGKQSRSIAQPLRDLEALGWIKRVQRVGTSNAYWVYTNPEEVESHGASGEEEGCDGPGDPALYSAPPPGDPAFHSAPPPRSTARPPRVVQRAKREPLNESQLTTPCSPPEGDEPAKLAVSPRERTRPPAAVLDPDFARFWDAYPRKVAKGGAERAWRTARKSADADTIINAIPRYKRQTNPKYYAHPSTWLNQRRWEDEDDRGRDNAELPVSPSAYVQTKPEWEFDTQWVPGKTRWKGRGASGATGGPASARGAPGGAPRATDGAMGGPERD